MGDFLSNPSLVWSVQGGWAEGACLDIRDVLAGAVGVLPSGGDDTAALQAAATAAAGGMLSLPPGAYTVTDWINLPSGVVVRGAPGTTIRQTTAGKGVFRGVDVSNVSISGLRLQGPGYATAMPSPEELGQIAISGACANIRITDCEVFDCYNGISVVGGRGVWIERNLVHDWMLYGIVASLSWNFSIDRNVLHTNRQAGAGNAYGIMATSNVALYGSTAQAHNSISFNQITGVPAWDGIMAHEAPDLSIVGNKIRDVRVGIDVGLFGTATVLTDLLVAANQIELTTTDTYAGAGAQHGGILVNGKAGPTYVQRAAITGNVIRGANAIPGYAPAGNTAAGIGLDKVRHAAVSGNVISGIGSAFGSFAGVMAFQPAGGFAVNGNAIDGDASAGVRVDDASLDALAVVGNTFVASTPASAIGVYVNGGTYGTPQIDLNATNAATAELIV